MHMSLLLGCHTDSTCVVICNPAPCHKSLLAVQQALVRLQSFAEMCRITNVMFDILVIL